jgi:hypothetical protein
MKGASIKIGNEEIYAWVKIAVAQGRLDRNTP